MTDALVTEFYTKSVRAEWRRLVKNPYFRLELDTTLHFLDKHLPPNGLVLDAGGGPGRYTLELARRGYDVVLLDATQANIDFARRMARRYGIRKKVREICCGSIIDLSRFGEATFDAVVCTGGPLSHVLDAGDRKRAVAELVRVVKPGGKLFVSVISRLGVMVEVLIDSPVELGMPHFDQLLDNGDYFGGHGFTACHFYLPEELREDFSRQDLQLIEMVGLEGLANHHIKELNRLANDEKLYNKWWETHLQVCTHPAVVGTSDHILIVCKRVGEKKEY